MSQKDILCLEVGGCCFMSHKILFYLLILISDQFAGLKSQQGLTLVRLRYAEEDLSYTHSEAMVALA